MVARRLNRVILLFLSMILLVVLAAGPAAAAPAAHAWSVGGSGPMGPPLQAGCGDGICDAYMSENASTCPQDCAATLVPVVTRVVTVTRVVVTRTPTPTSITSATPTPTTEEASAMPADTPVAIQPTPSSDGLGTLSGCDLAAYESRAQAWQKGYGGKASPESFVPSRTDNREIYVCKVQPVGELCIPIYQGLIKASQENMENDEWELPDPPGARTPDRRIDLFQCHPGRWSLVQRRMRTRPPPDGCVCTAPIWQRAHQDTGADRLPGCASHPWNGAGHCLCRSPLAEAGAPIGEYPRPPRLGYNPQGRWAQLDLTSDAPRSNALRGNASNALHPVVSWVRMKSVPSVSH
jgi:hypothetical protein